MNRKPLLVYDGDCGFCRRWIRRWKIWTGDRVEYAPYQEAAGRFPHIPEKNFQEAVQLIDQDGGNYGGAEAVFRTLAYAPGRAWLLRLYRKAPGFAAVSERAYRFVARRRPAFSVLTRWLCGPDLEPSSYVLTRWVFIRLIALIYGIAFLSLWVQVSGLIGSQGILPAERFLEFVGGRIGASRYWLVPTLFWLHPSDGMLHLLCAAGACVSLGALVGVFQGPLLLAAWALYLSLVSVGQNFLSFQWDSLLLEAGFLAAFFAPWRSLDRPSGQRQPPPVFLWLLRWLLFRLMFESGCVKLLSGDPRWRDLTALAYHYQTQCLPTWIGWYAHQLPLGFQALSALAMFFIELAAPFLIFTPRRPRMLAGALFIGFQLLIEATGNYAFFNLLTIALSLLLFDDAFWRRLLPRRWTEAFRSPSSPLAEGRWARALKAGRAALAAAVVVLSGAELASLFGLPIGPAAVLIQIEEPLMTVNGYGLFAVMTSRRYEIVLEGSRDGKTWEEYAFKWKPGDVKRRPAFAAPHQPRLDWQMWFAALGNYRHNPWVLSLMGCLLQGNRPVIGLLGKNPFPDAPPKRVRSLVYEYRFTDFAERRADGSWWRRELKGNYAPELRASAPEDAKGAADVRRSPPRP